MHSIKELSPVSGEILETYKPASRQDVNVAFAQAREAFQKTWGTTPLAQRIEFLKKLKAVLIGDFDIIVEKISAATGKIFLEALAADVIPCVDMIHYYVKNAEDILVSEKRKTPLFFRGSSFHVEYMPYGVVAVLSPWNYPFQLSLIPVITALTSGNCVILKPSEITPSIGNIIHELFNKAGFPPNVVQVLQGDQEVGKAIVESCPDKIFFTGSVATGRKIMEAAAPNLTPLELELGGKDPMIVFEDARLDRAVSGAVYGHLQTLGRPV